MLWVSLRTLRSSTASSGGRALRCLGMGHLLALLRCIFCTTLEERRTRAGDDSGGAGDAGDLRPTVSGRTGFAAESSGAADSDLPEIAGLRPSDHLRDPDAWAVLVHSAGADSAGSGAGHAARGNAHHGLWAVHGTHWLGVRRTGLGLCPLLVPGGRSDQARCLPPLRLAPAGVSSAASATKASDKIEVSTRPNPLVALPPPQ